VNLDVSGCRLTLLPKVSSTVLRQADFAKNSLSTLPEDFGCLTNLELLAIYDNILSFLPETLGQLSNLKRLGVMNNHLTALPKTFGQLTSLVDLYAMSNYITALPNTLSSLSGVTILNFSSNCISCFGPVLRLSSLKTLNVEKNQVTKLDSSFQTLIALENLVIGENAAPDSHTMDWRLEELSIIDLSHGKLSCVPPLLGTKLRELKLNRNKFGFSCDMSLLETLRMDCNRLSSLPSNMCMLSSLKVLAAHMNSVTSIPSGANILTSLKVLAMGQNRLSSVPLYFFDLPLISRLFIQRNVITNISEINLHSYYANHKDVSFFFEKSKCH